MTEGRLTYRWKKKPYVHQVQAIKKLMSTGFGGALLMEPRTGKTKVAVDYMAIQHLKGEINRVLVFAPLGVMGVWIDQLKENIPDDIEYRITFWDKDSRKEVELPRFGQNILDIVIVNYDALSTPGKAIGRDPKGNIKRSRRRGGRYDVKKKLIAWQPQLIILDESHRIKTPSAKKSTAIHSLQRVAPYRLILTGTVVTKKKRIFDIYSQWKFLNPQRFAHREGDPLTFSQFKRYFGLWTDREGYPKWLGNQHEDDLHKLIHLDSFSITREECYDLPRQTSQIIHVELEESAQVYDQMAEDMVARIKTGEITEASIRLVQRLRLQQITSGVTKTSPSAQYPEGRLVVVGAEKLRAIQSRLEDLMEADEKVVIGALFKPDLQRLETMIRKHLKVPVFVIKGGVKHADREYALKEFHRVDGGAIFLGQPAAAGEGIDLSCASILQWYSLTPSWVQFRQFSDRIALSEKPTFHEFFLARGTVDELLYETLLEDGDFGKKMITSPERLLRLQEQSMGSVH